MHVVHVGLLVLFLVIRCTWPVETDGRIVYKRSSTSSDQTFDDCRYDNDLVTISRHGCTISPMNPNIRYSISLLENGVEIDSFADFDPRQFCK